MVARRLPADGTIYEVSGERYEVDAHAAWLLAEETVRVVDGKGEADVVMDCRVGARPSCSQFLFPDGICKEAFEEHEDNCCVPRQIAAVLKIECADVCRDMDAVERRLYPDVPTSWHEVGCTPRMVLGGLGCVIVHNTRVVESLGSVDKNKTVAFAVHESHCYFYLSLIHI